MPAWVCSAASRTPELSGVRDSSRASRSGGGTRMMVSLIGEGFGVVCGAMIAGAPARGAGLIEPVGVVSGRVESAEERDSSSVWRRVIWSSLLSNCSWSSSCRLASRSTWPRRSAMRSS